MNDQDYIRKAVELADGFNGEEMETDYFVCCDWGDNGKIGQLWKLSSVPQRFLDALAAQLVRQVDALDDYGVFTEPEQTHVWEVEPPPEILGGELYEGGQWWHSEGPDRTMNTIKAIINSGVLSEQ